MDRRGTKGACPSRWDSGFDRPADSPIYINRLICPQAPGGSCRQLAARQSGCLAIGPFDVSELSEIRMTLEDLLLYGSLPGIVAVSQPEDKETDLASYVTGYLEEEIRSEALVRNVGQFARFLSL